ncbi:tyrosine-type recombinase/integrase [Rhodoplanes sp. Z2-YC6860]|uniref:tyrosine-type recombinase/integrase n=1 Tax=Rhodoplanes sp. Z2-YC6860 TaxID=674703 RepID=UPI000A074829|nr:tyrosine-type recombinase/integrase [Rhodoplanes sp. Z2-YC6860]
MKLATGATRIYYYAWRGGPRITALPGTPDFVRQYQEAHADLRAPAAGTFMTLIAAFKGSADYLKLASSTVRAYAAYIKLIEEEFGDLPLAALKDPRVRGEFKAWRDRFANTPRKADYAWSTLSRILSFSKDRGLISSNPCEGGGRLYAANRTDKIWQDTDVAALLGVAPPELALAMMLALWTGQRQGDLLRLPWSAYDGKHIRLTQSKTGRRIVVPAGQPLRTLLDRTERRGPLVLTTTRGRPWTSDGFRTSWGKACDRAGIRGLTFHDIRGSAVVRLALADATVPQIATFTGHSLRDVEAILDAHYLGRDVQLAEIAVMKLEARTKL